MTDRLKQLCDVINDVNTLVMMLSQELKMAKKWDYNNPEWKIREKSIYNILAELMAVVFVKYDRNEVSKALEERNIKQGNELREFIDTLGDVNISSDIVDLANKKGADA